MPSKRDLEFKESRKPLEHELKYTAPALGSNWSQQSYINLYLIYMFYILVTSNWNFITWFFRCAVFTEVEASNFNYFTDEWIYKYLPIRFRRQYTST